MSVETSPISLESRSKPQHESENNSLDLIFKNQAQALISEAQQKSFPQYWTVDRLAKFLKKSMPIHHELGAKEVYARMEATPYSELGSWTELNFFVVSDLGNSNLNVGPLELMRYTLEFENHNEAEYPTDMTHLFVKHKFVSPEEKDTELEQFAQNPLWRTTENCTILTQPYQIFPIQ